MPGIVEQGELCYGVQQGKNSPKRLPSSRSLGNRLGGVSSLSHTHLYISRRPFFLSEELLWLLYS